MYDTKLVEKILVVPALVILSIGWWRWWLYAGTSCIEAKRAICTLPEFSQPIDKNRAIITSSCINGTFSQTKSFSHQLQSFDDPKIEFINRCMSSRVPDKAEAQRRKDSFSKALSQHDRISVGETRCCWQHCPDQPYQAFFAQKSKLCDKAVETSLNNELG